MYHHVPVGQQGKLHKRSWHMRFPYWWQGALTVQDLWLTVVLLTCSLRNCRLWPRLYPYWKDKRRVPPFVQKVWQVPLGSDLGKFQIFAVQPIVYTACLCIHHLKCKYCFLRAAVVKIESYDFYGEANSNITAPILSPKCVARLARPSQDYMVA